MGKYSQGIALVLVHAEEPYFNPDTPVGIAITQSITDAVESTLKRGDRVYFLTLRQDEGLPPYLADFHGQVRIIGLARDETTRCQNLDLKIRLAGDEVAKARVMGYMEGYCVEDVRKMLGGCAIGDSISPDIAVDEFLKRRRLEHGELEEAISRHIVVY